MELKINEKEVKQIILEWAAEKYYNSFDDVKISADHGHLYSCTLYKKELLVENKEKRENLEE